MLTQIEEAFNGTPSVLYNAIVDGMHGLTPIAIQMMSMRIDPTGADMTCGAPSFEWIEPLPGV
jgi:hypothetical protein